MHHPKNLIRAFVAAAVPLALLTAGPASADDDDRPPTGVRTQLEATVAAGIPGMVAYVRRDGRTSQLAAGVSDRATGSPARATQRYRIGSMTKSFVATVLLQLEAEHRLSLDDTVDTWLPGLVHGNGNDGTRITLRQLLNHTSGLYEYNKDPRTFAPYYDRHDYDWVWTPRRLISIALSHAPDAEPGAAWGYANTNYAIAGLVIEAATGHRLATEIKRRIIAPLGLHDTSFPTTDPRIHGSHLQGYDDEFADVTRFSPSVGGAAGAMISNVEDVAHFYRALIGGRLLPRPQQQAMMTTVETPIPGFRDGLGIGSSEICGRTYWGHDGGFPGYGGNALTSADGSRQYVFGVNWLGLHTRNEAAENTETAAQTAALCGPAA